MKKFLLLFCMSIGVCLFTIALWPMQSFSFDEIPTLEAETFNKLVYTRKEISYPLLSIDAHDSPLPFDSKTNTWYTPAATEDVMFNVPCTWRIVRTPSSPNHGEAKVLIYNHTTYKEYTFIETGLPVIEIQLKRFDLDPKYIENWRTPASVRILSQSEDGTLSWFSDRIDIKTRGNSSLVYPKKSYTLFFAGAGQNESLASPLGLPADRKFALNSLYEDDSKIRDALAYNLWAKVEADNALQIAHTELLINGEYFGLYGIHGLPTENSLPYSKGDTVYKINSGLTINPRDYYGDVLPPFEITAGDPSDTENFSTFMQMFSADRSSFPSQLDFDSAVNYAAFMEMIACEDTYLQNMIVTYQVDTDQYFFTTWDMDHAFGSMWTENRPLLGENVFSQTEMRWLAPADKYLRILSVLYENCPDFADAVAARYRELRQTVFTDDMLLYEADRLYDSVTDSGARARDAARWPESAISEDNSFIEAFIPARMAFLDEEFANGRVIAN